MFDINEEEIDRLYGKLNSLLTCLRIRDLGYGYEKGSFVTIDLRTEEDGYGGPDQGTLITGLLGTAIGSGDVKENEEIKDELIALGAKIPYNLYDDDSTCGFTVILDNKDTSNYFKYKIKDESMIKKNERHITDNCCFYDESSVKDVQIIPNYKEDNFYIVLPEEYIVVEEFIDTCIDFIADIQEAVKKHEEKLAEGDAA